MVDDDEVLRRATKRVLNRLGYRVADCAGGIEALGLLDRGAFDVVLSDVQMPGIGGVQLLRSIQERYPAVPVVLMTGAPELSTATGAIEHRAFRYLVKPVDMELMDRALAQAIQSRRQADRDSESLGASVRSRMDDALAGLRLVLQRVVWAKNGAAFGQEVFVDSAEAGLSSLTLVEVARRTGRTSELGRALRVEVAEAMARAPSDGVFFVSLHPDELTDETLGDRNDPLTNVASRVVLQITEQESAASLHNVRDRVARLRRLGFRISLNNIGARYGGLSSYPQLEPEFVKLEASLVRDLQANKIQQKVIASVIRLGHELGQSVIAGGVKCAEERDVLVGLGCDLLQGELFEAGYSEWSSDVWRRHSRALIRCGSG